jgi:phenylacetate-CoA ligase
LSFLTIPRLLLRRRSLERSCRWSRAELTARQDVAVTALRRFALDRSPFYRRFHAGLESQPLDKLPVLTKSVLMQNFDDVVTDPAVRLRDAEAFLAAGPGDRLFRGRYVVLATSGSTGLRGVFLFDPDEWLTALAGITRPMLWAGVAPNPLRRRKMAMLASTTDSHYSARVGRSLASPFLPALRMDAGEPIERIVARLNDWQPEVMAVYPSVLRQLAAEQVAGRLRIRPDKIATSAEVLTAEDRRRAHEAWGVHVFDTYGCTEYAPIAAECEFGSRHLFEDGAVIELERDRVLLTVLGRRTQPLIRYEISDVVRSVEGGCACGRPFRTIETIEGRVEDVLRFGEIRVHPNRFHEILEAVPVSGWQVIQDKNDLRILLIGLRDPAALRAVEIAVEKLLKSEGVQMAFFQVSEVENLERGATGKAPLIVAR